MGWDEELLPKIVASLMVGGAVAGAILYRPVRSAVTQRRWILAALLGMAVALVVLELGVAITLQVLSIHGLEVLLLAWLFAPFVGLPALLTAGPLSGLGLVTVARFRERFGTSYPARDRRRRRSCR